MPPVQRKLLVLAALLLLAATPAAAAPLRLMAFGDSLVHGYGLPAGETFPEQLQAALAAAGETVTVINAGNSGETTAGAWARLDWTLVEAPDAVIVVLGGNDGLRGLDPAESEANLDAILAALGERRLPVLLAGMLAPRNLGGDYAATFDALFPRLAARHGALFYPFFLEGVAAVPELNQADGLHPNAAGVAEIVRRMLPQVRELIALAEAKRKETAGAGGDG